MAVVHNFIRIYDPADVIDGDDDSYGDTGGPRQGNVGREERQRANDRREKIAREMWDDYVHTRRRAD